MLRYCAWCGAYQGHKPGRGSQLRPDRCEIDTATICPCCLERLRSLERRESAPIACPHN